ncbi:phage tail assembly protein T [Burkholderia ambifaria]|uniref:phage tail assembly protein T n=1 Tax=Burkholderia ambifaria TaxID=152480 RepID=UPI003D15FABA
MDLGIPVRELQQRITSAEFVEYMASYQIDRRGGHYDDLRAGAITSMLANINRNTKVRREPFGTLEFIPWNEFHEAANEPHVPILLEDPNAQAELLFSTMFPNRNG